MHSFAERLLHELDKVEALMLELLDTSTIERFRNDPDSGIIIVAPPYYWGKADEQQQRLQMILKQAYLDWFERFQMLFDYASEEVHAEIDATHKSIMGWIDKTDRNWDVPPTIDEAKKKSAEKMSVFRRLIRLSTASSETRIVLVPDTNALIAVPDFVSYTNVAGQDAFQVVIVPTVLAELDHLKVTHRDAEFREKVNAVIRRIKGLRQQGSLLEGVTVNKTIQIKMVAAEPRFDRTLKWLDKGNNDDRIIASALEIQKAEPSALVVVVTSDINLQNKAEMARLPYAEPPS